MRLFLLAMAFCLANFTVLRAQATELTYAFSSPEACAGTTELIVDVTVDGLTELEAASFTIVWDPTIITFDPTDATEGPIDFNLANLSRSRFGFGPNGSFVDDGKMTFGWDSGNPNGTGASVNNGDRIFSIKFDILTSGMTSAITGDGSIAPVITFYAANNGTVGTTVFNPGSVRTSDFIAPTLTCPGNVSMNASAGQTSAAVANIGASASDNCTLASLSYQFSGATSGSSPLTGINDASGAVFNVGTTTVTYTATDAVNNSNTCSFDIEVISNTTSQTDVTFDVKDVNFTCSDTDAFIDVEVDNFVDVQGFQGTFVFDTTTFAYNPTNPVTNFNINVPNFSIADFNFSAVGNGQITFTYTNSTTFNLPNDALLFSVPLDVVGLTSTTSTIDGSRTSLFVVTQTNGTAGFANVIVSPGTISLVDSDGPLISNCPGPISASVVSGACNGPATWTPPTALDACDPNAQISSNFNPGDIFPIGVTTVVYIATDSSGNSSTCEFDVTISDDEPPTFDFCPTAQNFGLSSGECGFSGSILIPTASDPCGQVTVEPSSPLPSPFPIGTTTVTYIATDLSGNSASCTFDVNVADNDAPIVEFCPADTMFTAPANTCSAIGNWMTPVFSDTCGGVTVSSNFNVGDAVPLGTNLVVYTATDGSGNSAMCQFTVIVVENDAPIISNCPTNVSVSAPSGTCEAVVSYAIPTANDACDSAPTVSLTQGLASGSTFPVGSTMVAYVATDASGNVSDTCKFEVVVTDDEVPVLTCPSNQVLQAQLGSTGATASGINVTISDNCGVADTSFAITGATTFNGSGNASDLVFDIGVSTVTYLVTDVNGNVDSCSFTVTVNSSSNPPVIECPNDTSAIAFPSTCTNNFAGLDLVITSDAADIASITYELTGATVASSPAMGTNSVSGVDFANGTTTVIYTATNLDGVATMCSFTVEIIPGPGEPVACPADIMMDAALDSCGVTVFWNVPVPLDACGNPIMISGTSNPGDFFPVGITTVTYTATDVQGAQTVCSFDITISDVEAITVTNCPANITVAANMNGCEAINVQWMVPSFTSACTMPTVTASNNPGDSFPLGATTVTYTASLPDGATATCSFMVIVEDRSAPNINSCTPDVTVAAPMGSCEASVTWPDPVAFDNCSSVTFSYSIPNGSIFSVGDTTVTAFAMDASGNVDSCSFSVSVTGGTAPVIDCPRSIVYRADNRLISDPDNFIRSSFGDGCDGLFIDFDLPSAMTQCGTATVRQIGGPLSGSRFTVGFSFLLFEATAADGTTTQCQFSIGVEPVPTLEITSPDSTTCNGSTVILEATGIRSANYMWSGPNGFASTDSIITLSNITTAEEGTYIVNTTTEGGCDQVDSIIVSVDSNPVLEILTPGFVCGNQGNDLVLQVADALGQALVNFQWSGPNGFNSTLETPIIQNATPANSGLYTVVVTTQNGCSDRISKQIDVGTQPATPTVTLDDPTPCVDEDVMFTGTAYSGTSVTYTWTVSPSAGATLNEVNNVAIFRASVAGTFDICYSATVDGCTTEEVCTMVTVQEAPTFDITGDTDLSCSDGSQELRLEEVSGTASTYEWRGPNGNIVSTNPLLLIQNATAANAGLYSLRISSANGCIADTALNVRVSERPNPPIVQSDVTMLCLGESANLTGTDFGTGVNYIWTADATNLEAGIPGTSNQSMITVTPTIARTFNYDLVIERDGCFSETRSIDILVMDAPNAQASFDGNTDCVLPGQTITLLETLGEGTVTGWTGPLGFSSTLASPQITGFTDANSGIYTVTVENAAGCSSTSSVTINLNQGVAQLETFFDGDLCRGSTVQLFSTEVRGANYLWTGPNGFSSTDQNPVIQSLSPGLSGEFTVVATLPNGCSSLPSEPIVLTVLSEPEATDDFFDFVLDSDGGLINILGNDSLTDNSVNITITREPIFGTAVVTQDGFISYTSNATAPREDRVEYEVCYDDCPALCARAIINVELDFDTERCIFANVITPNGDGQNDNFYISCLEDPTQNPQNTLVIYNEYGDQVFSAAPYLNDWEGTHENERLPDGTYYFLFRDSPNGSEQRGFITIYR